MRSSYKELGAYIQEVDERNTDLKVDRLLGVSIEKRFMPSIANIIGTDMTTYKIVKRNQFAYGPVTSRNGDKISIALQDQYDEAIVSQAYVPFEIIDTKELLPEYLMMWFRRPEFDRYTRFMSHGSAREIFEWDEMCKVKLPIPHPDKQKELVKEYNAIVNRINLNNQLIQKLEETAQAIYKQWFGEFEFPDENGQPYKSSGGEMVFDKELEKEAPKGWEVKKLKTCCSKIGSGSTPDGGKENYKEDGISLIRSMNVYDFVFYLDELAFIDDTQAAELRNVTVEEKDILFNITGVSVARCCMVPKQVLPARVNQHVMILRPYKELYLAYYILSHLCYSENKNKLLGISQSGSTREAITKTELEEYLLLVPNERVAKDFEYKIRAIINDLQVKNHINYSLLKFKNILLSKLATIEN